MGVSEGPAEGGEGAPIGRALEAPQSDAAVEAGRGEELLGQKLSLIHI